MVAGFRNSPLKTNNGKSPFLMGNHHFLWEITICNGKSSFLTNSSSIKPRKLKKGLIHQTSITP